MQKRRARRHLQLFPIREYLASRHLRHRQNPLLLLEGILISKESKEYSHLVIQPALLPGSQHQRRLRSQHQRRLRSLQSQQLQSEPWWIYLEPKDIFRRKIFSPKDISKDIHPSTCFPAKTQPKEVWEIQKQLQHFCISDVILSTNYSFQNPLYDSKSGTNKNHA